MSAVVGSALFLCVSLGEQSWACGPWKLSNNNSPPAKSPHLLGHTTLSRWFLSICSPTHPNIPANCCESYHQCWSFGMADLPKPHTKARIQTVGFISHFSSPTGVERAERLKKCGQSATFAHSQESFISLLVGQTAQTDLILLLLLKGRWICSHFKSHEVSWAYWEYSPVIHKHNECCCEWMLTVLAIWKLYRQFSFNSNTLW